LEESKRLITSQKEKILELEVKLGG
jgi:hypothetical protein